MAWDKWYDDLNDVCANCGKIAGTHCGGLGDLESMGKCPNPDPKGSYYQNSKFKAMPKVVVPGVKKTAPKKEKKKKDKNWETPKFNTPKEPKGEIKYYKTIPGGEPIEIEAPETNPCAEILVETGYPTVDANGFHIYKHNIGTPTGQGKTIFIETLKDAVKQLEVSQFEATYSVPHYNASPYYDPMEDWEADRRERGLKQLVVDFVQRYGRGRDPVDVGVALVKFVEKEGHRYSYQSEEVIRLRERVSDMSKDVAYHKQEIKQLQEEMAWMVKKREVKPAISPKGRKFKQE